MFGYVRVYKPDLRMSEYEHYQGIYCSLCKQLGKRYGFFARMTLSYDYTFLAVLKMGLDNHCKGFKKGRCAFNPLKKRTCSCENEHIEYTADVASILVYFKIKDNILDSGFFKSLPSRLLLPFASLARRKAAKRHPAIDKAVFECMEQQKKLETEKTASIDAAAEPTAKILSILATSGITNENEKRIMNRFGYCLGRWIYLIDAADDIEDDLKLGNYNPFVNLYSIKDSNYKDKILPNLMHTLNACLAECIAAYDLLKIYRFDGILRNVLEQGMPSVQQQVLQKKGNKNERK